MMVSHHALQSTDPLYHFVYSFHMPLFFILSGMFAKDANSIPFKHFIKKNAKRLLLPYVVTMAMLCLWGGIQSYCKDDISYFMRDFLSFLAASTDGWETRWGLVSAGPMWFLIALFLVRIEFYWLQHIVNKFTSQYNDIILLLCSIVLSVIAVIIHPYLPSLPFCIMQSLTALAFYVVGWYVHKHPLPKWAYIICVLCWPLAIRYGYVGLSSCTMQIYPISFIGACGGTYMVYLLCKGLDTLRSYIIHYSHHAFHLPSPLAWCGHYSLPVLCMHDFELYSSFMWSIACRLPIHYERIWGGGGCNHLRMDYLANSLY